MKLRKLDFIADVQMNLQNTEGVIVPKKNQHIDFDRIAQAVVDAGFSVRFLKADYTAGKIAINNDCILYEHDKVVLPFEKIKTEGTIKLRFLGKKYMPAVEYKKIKDALTDNCPKAHGTTYFADIDEPAKN
jgi:hypothetical protein